jgi:drug/metabolite transporter (DMT)-like permease
LVLIPFGFILPENKYIILAFAIGILFTCLLVVLYKAVQAAEASRIVPLIGGATSVFIFILAYFFLGERLAANQVLAFIFFAVGGYLLSSKINNGKTIIIKGAYLAILAAFLFAVVYVAKKYLFSHIDFTSGFMIIQLGNFFGAIVLVLLPGNRKVIFSASNEVAKGNRQTAYLFFPTKIFGALAAILIDYAISIKDASVTIINSLQAVQYVFIFIFAIILSKKYPIFLKEQIGDKAIKRKAFAIILIGVGLIFYFTEINTL